jgi:hypothetical protein
MIWGMPEVSGRANKTRYNLSAWRAASSAAFGKLDIQADQPEQFWVLASAVSVGDVSLTDMHTSAHSVARTTNDAAAQKKAYCKLSLQLSGSSMLSQDDRSCVLHPGDLALYVQQRPYELIYPEEQHSLIVHFPQNFVNLSPQQIRQITANPICKDRGFGKVAVPLFEQLANNIDILEGPHANSLVRSSLNMLVTVLSAELEADQESSSGNLLFRQATAYIDQNLGDPELSPQSIAQALFVSVRHLHAKFADQDMSVGSYIRMRRLEKIHSDLADPLYAKDSIGAISARYGLHDPSHFSRIFKAQYKESPSRYRARILQ